MKGFIDKIQDTIGIDLTIVIILASLLLIFALLLPDGNILRIVFGLPFLLFLPGYSFVSALWAKKSELEPLERVVFSLGLSLSLVPLAGLGLNYTPWGITLISVVVCLYLLIMILAGIAWLRRSKLSPNERFAVKPESLFYRADTMSSTDLLMVLLVVIVVIIGAGLLTYIVLNPPAEQFTELYILDQNGTTENYPTSLSVNESASIIINVVSHERHSTDYSVMVTLQSENYENSTLARYDFFLDNWDKWYQPFNFSVNESGEFKLIISLFKENDSVPYATNHLWLDVRN
ncbi:MAG: DUF1616 domain-containing protein [Thermoplasmata archaeon]|nr:MAG: DUF1616 domain-containing protein [Thermoplasmata archaeon]